MTLQKHCTTPKERRLALKQIIEEYADCREELDLDGTVKIIEAMFGANKAKKQLAEGYHRPVCAKCNCELYPKTNGVGVLDMASFGPYRLYHADLWKCPECGLEVVGGFGRGPIAAHYLKDFQKVIDNYEKSGLLIRNNG